MKRIGRNIRLVHYHKPLGNKMGVRDNETEPLPFHPLAPVSVEPRIFQARWLPCISTVGLFIAGIICTFLGDVTEWPINGPDKRGTVELTRVSCFSRDAIRFNVAEAFPWVITRFTRSFESWSGQVILLPSKTEYQASLVDPELV